MIIISLILHILKHSNKTFKKEWKPLLAIKKIKVYKK